MCKIFDDVDDASWFTSSLLNDIIEYHAPCKTKVVKCESVPYMNSVLRKASYKRNMAQNTLDNMVKSTRKKIVPIVIKLFPYCSRHDKSFCPTVSPFISDKNKRADSKIILQEGEVTIVDSLKIANVFDDYFYDMALNIGFGDSITSSCDAIA